MLKEILRKGAWLVAVVSLAACGVPPEPTQDGLVCTSGNVTFSISSVQIEAAPAFPEPSFASERSITVGDEIVVIQFSAALSEKEPLKVRSTLFLDDGQKADPEPSSLILPDFQTYSEEFSGTPPYDAEFAMGFTVPKGTSPDVFRVESCVFDLASGRTE